MSTRIIISISSDIGNALALSWLEEGHTLYGTFRTRTPTVDELEAAGVNLIHCDLSRIGEVNTAAQKLTDHHIEWDVLVLSAGDMSPVGSFQEVNFDEWSKSFEVNFLAQLRFVHSLLLNRHSNQKARPQPSVIFFAGGGTNCAFPNYSAYTSAKIGLIKICELLDAEVPDVKFSIIGPGWVNTKIHNSTLEAEEKSGTKMLETNARLSSGNFVSMGRVVECVDWVIAKPRDVVSGRNFSLVYDAWGNTELDLLLRNDPDMYKLRRHKNSILVNRCDD